MITKISKKIIVFFLLISCMMNACVMEVSAYNVDNLLSRLNYVQTPLLEFNEPIDYVVNYSESFWGKVDMFLVNWGLSPAIQGMSGQWVLTYEQCLMSLLSDDSLLMSFCDSYPEYFFDTTSKVCDILDEKFKLELNVSFDALDLVNNVTKDSIKKNVSECTEKIIYLTMLSAQTDNEDLKTACMNCCNSVYSNTIYFLMDFLMNTMGNQLGEFAELAAQLDTILSEALNTGLMASTIFIRDAVKGFSSAFKVLALKDIIINVHGIPKKVDSAMEIVAYTNICYDTMPIYHQAVEAYQSGDKSKEIEIFETFNIMLNARKNSYESLKTLLGGKWKKALKKNPTLAEHYQELQDIDITNYKCEYSSGADDLEEDVWIIGIDKKDEEDVWVIGLDPDEDDEKEIIEHPELDLYRSFLSDNTWIYQYEPDYLYKRMAVYDLYNDGIFEVAFEYCGSSWANYTVGLLSYSAESGMVVTVENALEQNNMASDLRYINEKEGTFIKNRTRGKQIDMYYRLSASGIPEEISSYAICYLSGTSDQESHGWTAELIEEYKNAIKDMYEPVWVDITDENLDFYLTGSGNKTGLGKMYSTPLVENDNEVWENIRELSPEEVRKLGFSLNVPEDIEITDYHISAPWYWEGADRWLIDVELMNGNTFLAGASVDPDTLELMRQIAPYYVEEEIDEKERQEIIDSINQMENLVRMALYNSEYYIPETQSGDWIHYNSERFWQMLALCGLPDDGNGRYSEGCLCISEEEAIELTYALVKGFNGILPSNSDYGFMKNGKYYLGLSQPEPVKLTFEDYSENSDGCLTVSYTYSYYYEEPNSIDGALDVYFKKNSFNNENTIFNIPYTICYLTFPKMVNGSRYVSVIPGNDSDNSEYVISESNTRYLTEADLSGLSKEQLRLARNEIYARKGRTFKAEDLISYFNSKSWYEGTVDPDYFSAHETELLNEYEQYNAYFILDYENS